MFLGKFELEEEVAVVVVVVVAVVVAVAAAVVVEGKGVELELGVTALYLVFLLIEQGCFVKETEYHVVVGTIAEPWIDKT